MDLNASLIINSSIHVNAFPKSDSAHGNSGGQNIRLDITSVNCHPVQCYGQATSFQDNFLHIYKVNPTHYLCLARRQTRNGAVWLSLAQQNHIGNSFFNCRCVAYGLIPLVRMTEEDELTTIQWDWLNVG